MGRDAVRQFALDILEDEFYRVSVKARAIEGTLPPQLEQMLYHYAYGKPPDEIIVHDGLDDLSHLSNSELAVLARKLETALVKTEDIGMAH